MIASISPVREVCGPFCVRFTPPENSRDFIMSGIAEFADIFTLTMGLVIWTELVIRPTRVARRRRATVAERDLIELTDGFTAVAGPMTEKWLIADAGFGPIAISPMSVIRVLPPAAEETREYPVSLPAETEAS
jgi:hypothetical protein